MKATYDHRAVYYVPEDGGPECRKCGVPTRGIMSTLRHHDEPERRVEPIPEDADGFAEAWTVAANVLGDADPDDTVLAVARQVAERLYEAGWLRRTRKRPDLS